MLADYSHLWVYVVGPLAGAVIAVVFAWLLRGAGGDVGGLAAARGALDQVVQQARGEDAQSEKDTGQESAGASEPHT